ncbi:LacI family DNA-binding transcriptional regulator [Sinosporangium album]|uniref:LacI family DNA-binding transcriptional regulator n=1 Tax=Sinosporangium album TaxID=504805 RepID=UPI0015A2E004|nr:LacI family DNA-binding transcriptional regulator [Sinosporangium album]
MDSGPDAGVARPPSRRPTGRDVAELAGVSQATVSLVFSGAGDRRVSKATQQRVRLAALRLRYQPQAAARQLRLGRTDLILLAVPNIRGQFFAKMLAGAHEAAAKEGLTVVVSSDWSSEMLTRTTTMNQFDGLLLCSPLDRQVGEPPAFIPAVFVDADPALTGEGRQVLELDVAGGMRMALKHLVKLGHRRVGRLRYRRQAYTFRARQRAFEEATAHLDVAEREIAPREGLDASRAAALELLRLDDPPSAVMCDDDAAAAGVYHAAAELGLRIPDDISVVGMDDIDAAELFTPGLTTVDLKGEEIGRLAMSAVAALLRGDEPGVLKPVSPDLVVRSSTARPAPRRGGTGQE